MLNTINNPISYLILLLSIEFISCNTAPNSKIELCYKTCLSGEKKTIGVKINEKKEGLWLEYNDDCHLSIAFSYVNDVQNGSFVSYWDDGTVLAVGTLKNGVENGYFQQFHSNSKLYRVGNMVNGVPQGIWEYYTENGLLNIKIEHLKDSNKTLLDNHLEIPLPPKPPKE